LIIEIWYFDVEINCVTKTALFPLSPGSTLFVGNLSWDVDEDTLSEFFSSQGYAPSSVRVITGQDGRSKG